MLQLEKYYDFIMKLLGHSLMESYIIIVTKRYTFTTLLLLLLLIFIYNINTITLHLNSDQILRKYNIKTDTE